MSDNLEEVNIKIFENSDNGFEIRMIIGEMFFNNEKEWKEFEKLIDLGKAETLSNGKKKFGYSRRQINIRGD